MLLLCKPFLTMFGCRGLFCRSLRPCRSRMRNLQTSAFRDPWVPLCHTSNAFWALCFGFFLVELSGSSPHLPDQLLVYFNRILPGFKWQGSGLSCCFKPHLAGSNGEKRYRDRSMTHYYQIFEVPVTVFPSMTCKKKNTEVFILEPYFYVFFM